MLEYWASNPNCSKFAITFSFFYLSGLFMVDRVPSSIVISLTQTDSLTVTPSPDDNADFQPNKEFGELKVALRHSRAKFF